MGDSAIRHLGQCGNARRSTKNQVDRHTSLQEIKGIAKTAVCLFSAEVQTKAAQCPNLKPDGRLARCFIQKKRFVLRIHRICNFGWREVVMIATSGPVCWKAVELGLGLKAQGTSTRTKNLWIASTPLTARTIV